MLGLARARLEDDRPASSFGLALSLEEARALEPDALLHALAEHKLLVLRRENLRFEIADFVQFMAKLGRIAEHPLTQFAVPNHRGVLRLSNLYVDGAPTGVHEGGTYWHTDMSYKRENQVLTALYSVEVPERPSVSATEFVDCELVPELARELAEHGAGVDLLTCTVWHRFGNRERSRDEGAPEQVLNDEQLASVGKAVSHPLVLQHPLSLRRYLYGVAATSVLIEGSSAADSARVLDALLDALLARAPRHTHHYRKGELVIWDNLSLLHRGVPAPISHDPKNCRLLYRINVDYRKPR
jgi:taurine dioxygenase